MIWLIVSNFCWLVLSHLNLQGDTSKLEHSLSGMNYPRMFLNTAKTRLGYRVGQLNVVSSPYRWCVPVAHHPSRQHVYLCIVYTTSTIYTTGIHGRSQTRRWIQVVEVQQGICDIIHPALKVHERCRSWQRFLGNVQFWTMASSNWTQFLLGRTELFVSSFCIFCCFQRCNERADTRIGYVHRTWHPLHRVDGECRDWMFFCVVLIVNTTIPMPRKKTMSRKKTTPRKKTTRKKTTHKKTTHKKTTRKKTTHKKTTQKKLEIKFSFINFG